MTDSLLYRFAIIPGTRRALRRLQGRRLDAGTPDWGRGRIDPFNPVKYTILKQPIDTTIGHSDMVPLWNLKQHHGLYHWDGLNTDLQEVVLSSALGDGATMKWVDGISPKWNNTAPRTMSSLRRVTNYIERAGAPDTRFRSTARWRRPAKRSKRDCASCHAFGGTRTGTVVPVAEVGTDRHRLDMWTPASATAYNAYGAGHAWKFSRFSSTKGYASVWLEGLWLRAPYLHNGSVPSLVALLQPVDQRPTHFTRGYDVYDPDQIGFISTGPDAAKVGTPFDTSLPGNSNAGHTYGVTLPADSKRALLEYLKTL